MPQVFIMSGPSGCGKTSLCTAWLAASPNMRLSISCTTRQARPAEEDGVHYHFLNDKAFTQQLQQHAFLEHAFVHGHWYGTRTADVQKMLEQGYDVLLEIDWQGAAQVAKQLPQATRLFMLPPSIEALRERLMHRAQDDQSIIDQRVSAAQEEMTHRDEADIQIINDQFDATLQTLLTLNQSP